MNIFDYIKIISEHQPLPEFDEEFEKVYAPYMANLFFSFFPDTSYIANLVNGQNPMSKQNHFLFLWSIIRKQRRQSKWFKATKDDDIEFLQNVYNVGESRAIAFKTLLNSEQLLELRRNRSIGGQIGKVK